MNELPPDCGCDDPDWLQTGYAYYRDHMTEVWHCNSCGVSMERNDFYPATSPEKCSTQEYIDKMLLDK